MGNRLPHKSDPVGFYCEQYPSFASVVYDHGQYQWQDAAWRESQLNDKRSSRSPSTSCTWAPGSATPTATA